MAEKVPSEDFEQMHFVKWFRQNQGGVRIAAIPNGGARSPATASKLKATGVSKGIPDLVVPEWHLWIEMKRTKGGCVDPDQKDWHEYLRECGDDVLVCYGCDDAIKQIEVYKKDRGLL